MKWTECPASIRATMLKDEELRRVEAVSGFWEGEGEGGAGSDRIMWGIHQKRLGQIDYHGDHILFWRVPYQVVVVAANELVAVKAIRNGRGQVHRLVRCELRHGLHRLVPVHLVMGAWAWPVNAIRASIVPV